MSTLAILAEEHVSTADFSGWNALIQFKQRASRLLKPKSTLSAQQTMRKVTTEFIKAYHIFQVQVNLIHTSYKLLKYDYFTAFSYMGASQLLFFFSCPYYIQLTQLRGLLLKQKSLPLNQKITAEPYSRN
jgi:hypothetical protein